MSRNNLKYLYRVMYKNGSIYDQNIEDVSVNDPTRSCYSDIKLDDIHYFTLSNGLDSYTLDLNDGGFSVNGSSKIYLHWEPLSNLKLLHYRRIVLSIAEDAKSYTVNFILGYEAETETQERVSKYIIIK